MGRWTQQHSAGGVVLRHDDACTHVLLIKPKNRSRWQLAKGMIDPGETSEVTAVREVREECGVTATIVAPLTPIRFFYQMQGQRFVKTVDFFLMNYKSGSTMDHDDEVDDACWFPVDEALKTITFETERAVIQEALAVADARRQPAVS